VTPNDRALEAVVTAWTILLVFLLLLAALSELRDYLRRRKDR